MVVAVVVGFAVVVQTTMDAMPRVASSAAVHSDAPAANADAASAPDDDCRHF
jgi:hypothetical protein